RDKKKQLETRFKERRTLLTSLSSTLSDQNQALDRLQDSRSRLQTVLDRAGVHFVSKLKGEFAQFKGNLSWPVKGRFLERYGDSRGVGSLTWQGVLIEAKPGDKIKAISGGQVVFADWMRNLGQLLIVKHDEHYMTLYAHNQSLLKAVGDTVQAGDVIASVGNSGGHEKPGLYFEIRHDGKPVDPASWLSKR
ncbi:MAG: peptidoglycan DD-metalloendopeptidase family protein, partial [Pseudomonadota bacterium]